MVDIKKLATEMALRGKTAEHGFLFDVIPMPGEIEVLRIEVEDREELPIFLSVSDDQILCLVYLFKEDEIRAGQLPELNNALLQANITMPLSAFGKIDGQYVIYGALSVHSSLHDLVHEIETLSSNSIASITAVREHLK